MPSTGVVQQDKGPADARTFCSHAGKRLRYQSGPCFGLGVPGELVVISDGFLSSRGKLAQIAAVQPEGKNVRGAMNGSEEAG